MIDPQLNKLAQEASVGDEAKAFLQSDLGKDIQQKAQSEIDGLINELLNARPSTWLQRLLGKDDIGDIQTQIKIRQQSLDWLLECIRLGDEAYETLEELTSDD